MTSRATLTFLALCLALSACWGSPPPRAENVITPEGYYAGDYLLGFDGPTQMVFTPDGDLVVAELNGAENDAQGQIVLVNSENLFEQTVLQEDLDKPTGVAVTGDRLWIMERQRLSVTSLVPGDRREIVADDLPFNGRSQGTLTVTAEGTLLYNTSGAKRGPDRTPGSGTLYAIANAANGPSEPTVVATGFKHAYAHLQDPRGQLWTVEMTDGNFDEERASDELVAIEEGDDAGWPQCVENNRAVREYGGTAELCAQAPHSHALFGAGATPTSFVISPWNEDEFIVALWLPGQVVTVPRTPPAGAPYAPVTFLEGIESPQHLLVDGDRLFVSDHETGTIFVITRN